jgi:hypothetical protein
MTFQIIHKPNGQTIRHELAGFVDPSTAVPRRAQKLKRVGNFTQRNPTPFVSEVGTNYKPGHFFDLAHDQCRTIVLDENNLRCGKRVRSEWVRAGRMTCDDCAKKMYTSQGGKS